MDNIEKVLGILKRSGTGWDLYYKRGKCQIYQWLSR